VFGRQYPGPSYGDLQLPPCGYPNHQCGYDLEKLDFFSIISLEFYNHCSSYQAIQKLPCDRLLDSLDVTRIIKTITP
jgi:hypothetical protein